VKIELNPLKWMPQSSAVVTAAAPAAPVAEEVRPAKAEESVMSTGAVVVQPAKANKFVSFLTSLLHAAEKGLGWAVKYAIPVGGLVSLLFPAAKPAAAATAVAADLIQKAVILVEQKYAASGAASGTGALKLAEVLVLTEDAVVQLLKQEGINADTTYVTNLVNAVVGVLNVQNAAPQLA